MTAIEFAYLLNNPESITPKQAQEIEKLRGKYPFLQCAASLNLKELYKKNSFGYNNELKKVAALTADRTILFDFITSDMFLAKIMPSEDKKNKAFELFKEDIDTVKQYATSQEEESIPTEDIGKITDNEQKTIESEVENVETDTTKDDITLSKIPSEEVLIAVFENRESLVHDSQTEPIRQGIEEKDDILAQQDTISKQSDTQKEAFVEKQEVLDEVTLDKDEAESNPYATDKVNLIDSTTDEEQLYSIDSQEYELELLVPFSEVDSTINQETINEEITNLDDRVGQINIENQYQDSQSESLTEENLTELYHDFLTPEHSQSDVEEVAQNQFVDDTIDLNKSYSELLLEVLSEEDYQDEATVQSEYYLDKSSMDTEQIFENQDEDYSYLYPDISQHLSNQEEISPEITIEISDVQENSIIIDEDLDESAQDVLPDNTDIVDEIDEYYVSGEEDNLEEEIIASNYKNEDVAQDVALIEEQLEIGTPLTFAKQDMMSFGEWLQATRIKPIERTVDHNFLSDVQTNEFVSSTTENLYSEEQKYTDFQKNDSKEEIVDDKVEDKQEVYKEVSQEEKENEILREKLKKIAIIDRFIEENPKIVADKNAPLAPPIEEPKYDQATLMTETLARVYLEQKKYQKAIDAYEILILKYPEKSITFADRIKNIKKLQQNNK
ncbi:MAG: hypothetical protein Q4B43_02845 [Bacteroidota bacterium]|nr:hypothetical protein [Bacteroidota bacterium]